MHVIDYSKKLLNRLDLALAKAYEDFQKTCQDANTMASTLNNAGSAIPALSSLGMLVSRSLTLTAERELYNLMLATYEHLLDVERFSAPDEGAAIASKFASDVLARDIHRMLMTEKLSGVKPQAVTGWRFAQQPSDIKYAEDLFIVPGGDKNPSDYYPNFALYDPYFAINPSKMITSGPRGELFDMFYTTRDMETMPEAIHDHVEINSSTQVKAENGFALPSEFHAYYGTEIEFIAINAPELANKGDFTVVASAKLPDGKTIFTKLLLRIKGTKIEHRYVQSYDNNYGYGYGSNLQQEVQKFIQENYLQDTVNLGFWNKHQTPLLKTEEQGANLVLPQIDINTSVLDPKSGTMFAGLQGTWPKAFTHVILKRLQMALQIKPTRQYGQELTGEERLGLYAQFAESFGKDNCLDRGYGSQCRWSETLNIPSKWSFGDGSVEPTDAQKAEGTYLLINYPGDGHGSNALAQIKFYPYVCKLEVVPLFDTKLSPRSEYYILTQTLAYRNSEIKRREDIEAARAQ